jgi:hypothetical protein
MSNSFENAPQAPISPHLSRTTEEIESSWSPPDFAALMVYLEFSKAAGHDIRVGIVTQPWKNISLYFDTPNKTEQACQEAWLHLRKQCQEVLCILRSPGFTWDSENHLPVAVEENWNEFALVGPPRPVDHRTSDMF